VLEIKNASDRKRYIVKHPYPFFLERGTLRLTGPKGSIDPSRSSSNGFYGETLMEPLRPGEVKRVRLDDLRGACTGLLPWGPRRQALNVQDGKYVVQFRFKSPKLPPRMVVGRYASDGKKIYKDTDPEVLAKHWFGELDSAPVAFELAPLSKDDLVVHEWGVFAVFNGAQVAAAHSREEWGSLPSFFYRQFPKERLCWCPSYWDKPVIYFYAKPPSLHVNVKVTFAKGAPVVWWPAVADPVNESTDPDARKPRSQPFQSLTWYAWLGDRVPATIATEEIGVPFGAPWAKVADFPLPKDCWLQQARLPDATRLTVLGNIEGPPRIWFPGGKNRPETERFLYYDGVVPAPDYLRCEKVDANSVTLHSFAQFDIARVFVVDRRTKDVISFSSAAPIGAGALIKVVPSRIPATDWPAAGLKSVRQSLLDAGLFAPEADALLAIWRKRFFETDGLTVFYLLPAAEYDRMLPLSILPVPAGAPVRVGIALHPHMEFEPDLAARVAPLIRQLEDPDFKKRSAAMAKLLEIGPMAITLLRTELQKPLSLETRRRIEGVLDRVDARTWLGWIAPK
jgi:hypothetical protein